MAEDEARGDASANVVEARRLRGCKVHTSACQWEGICDMNHGVRWRCREAATTRSTCGTSEIETLHKR